jgi:fructose-1,6-bisphosphatase/inositol monophosphatase family enzyme
MPVPNPERVVEKLVELGAMTRDVVVKSHARTDNATVSHAAEADTIYRIDTDVEPMLIDFCDHWSKELPLVLIAEGIEDEHGREGARVFPRGTRAEDAVVRVIVDPIDGTRGIMYDKRSAWSLAGVAVNRGESTRLADIEVAVMTELPTSKLRYGDVLSAIRGRGVIARRVDLLDGSVSSFTPRPSGAKRIDHGFASVSNFFPGTKVLASELMETIARSLIGEADVTRATVFDDQYISTGGQFYELIVGHDRFNCDLRPMFYGITGGPRGLAVHPYDVATALVATEAGVILTDGLGRPLDGPMDCTTDITWAGYANDAIRRQIEPLIRAFFEGRGRYDANKT